MKEPFSENDPVFKLLGEAKSVEPRADFTQNVLRAIRQESPKPTLLQKLLGSWYENLGNKALLGGLATTCAIALTLTWVAITPSPTPDPSFVQNFAPSGHELVSPADSLSLIADGVESDWEIIEELDQLLAVQNTTDLSDSQIALLLY